MKSKSFVILNIAFLFVISGYVTVNSDTGTDAIKLQVLPFTHDTSPNAELVSDQAAFILRRLLRAGRFILPDFVELKKQGIPLVWNTQQQIDDFCLAEAIDWLVIGRVEKIVMDPEAQLKGNRFIGMAGIPIKGEISVYLYDCHGKQHVWEDSHIAKTHVPGMRVLGINRRPFPKTVKTADAFVYDTMLLFSEQIIATIRSFKAVKDN